MAQPGWWVAAEIIGRRGEDLALTSANDAFVALSQTVPAFAGLSHQTLGFVGRTVAPETPAGIGS